jgi:tight adherence protein B
VIKRRQAKFLIEFANAIDIIVRDVKSGLPLSDCLQIIAAEAPEPVRGEFVDLVEQQKVGVPLSRAFERMSERMPLQEVNFFAIVIAIQAQTGGNLAEALGNLSSVLRDRYRLQAKVRAFSSEAKASAMIIGSLPPCSASTQRCAYRGNQALARCLTSALAPSAHSAISGKSRMART